MVVGIIPANTGRIGTVTNAGAASGGSSPRIRGELRMIAADNEWTGIIPANTGRMRLSSLASWMIQGSSPRIRGECKQVAACPAARRIIPANTGRIRKRARSARVRRDHPREYGENDTWLTFEQTTRGSSPRIRGESAAALNDTKIAGIIPANTGRIYIVVRRLIQAWDHPREYGENSIFPSASPA